MSQNKRTMNKKRLTKFFQDWFEKSIEELEGKKLIFPDDWPEDFSEKSAQYFLEYFGVDDEE